MSATAIVHHSLRASVLEEAAKVWAMLTEPHPAVAKPEQRRRARMLAAILIIVIPLALLGEVTSLGNRPGIPLFQNQEFALTIGTCVVLMVAYTFSRTRYQIWGAALALVTISLATLIAAALTPESINTLLVFLLIPIMLGSLLLSAWGVVVLIVVNLIGILLLPVVNSAVASGMVVIPLIYIVILSIVVVVSAGVRANDLSQIERQATELAVAVEQAKLANKLKDEFLANMSHELRTPLNAIIGFAEVMLMGLTGELDPRAKRSIERIHFNSERLLALIEDLLDISKIEAGRAEIIRQPFRLDELLNAVEMTIKPLAVKKSALNLVAELDPALPELLVGDSKRLEQVAINLASNAVKFTEAGSVKMLLKRVTEGQWAIVVSDTGIGIAPHAQEVIFEKFRQIDGSSRRAYSGTGLGLAIVKELALLMDGKVNVESAIGKGSTFTVTLPLIVPEKVKRV